MPSLLLRTSIIGAVVVAVLYQFVLQSLIFEVLGYGRVVRTIDTFSNVQCQKIDDLGLEGCEDMWLNDRDGLLYMACSDSPSRVQWLPALDFLLLLAMNYHLQTLDWIISMHQVEVLQIGLWFSTLELPVPLHPVFDT